MMHALTEFHFLRPLALLLIAALPLFWLLWRRGHTDAGAWHAVVDAHLLPYLIERVDDAPARGGSVLAAVLWTLACIALAGPAWERESMPLYRNEAVRVIALELAPTMLAVDEKPSRLARARYKIDDILARSRDAQTALIGYAGAAFVVAPLTDDVATVRNLVDALDPGTMPIAGNATAAAIEAAANLIEQSGQHRGDILLIADGVSADAATAANKARARGFTVSVLGVGSASGAPVTLEHGGFLKDQAGNMLIPRVDAAALQAVAEAGGGRYAGLSSVDSRDLDLLLAERVAGDRASDTGSDGQAQSGRWRDRGPWLLLVLVPLALFGFRRGWLMLVALAVMAPAAHPARAATLADLWQRPDQQAAKALAAGDAQSAAAVASSPEWRASAAYKNGDYAAAAGDYAQMPGADGAYNKGNALAKQGRYEEAIAAYDEALKQAPDMEDAQANRKVVEDFLKQQQQQNSAKNDKNAAQQGDKQDGQQKDGQQQGGQQQDGQQQDGQQQDGQQQSGQQQSGQQQDGQQQGGQQQSGQQQSGQQQNEQQQGAQDSSGAENGEQNAKQNASADEKQKGEKPKSAQSASDKDETAQNGAVPSNTAKPDAEQQKALAQSIDKALADGQQAAAQKAAQAQSAVVRKEEATREKQQVLEHMLQRVPDDPGGLLRRKFQLEYQRRQNGGGNGS
ncbi:MAG: VWA domain-containing protein [Rhodanobacter sp.]|jgi:Ca-activated chloride channel family protein|nr:VWA domain-containing protein [Rhodanobacter sp.]